MTAHRDPLDITTQYYYFKPMCAYFSSFALRAYRNAGCRLVPPILDLGCNDGTFGTILGLTQDQPVSLIGLDIDLVMLRKAESNNNKQYSAFVNSDATNLPFSDSSISTIFANYIFPSVNDLPAAITEIRRVLTADGRFYCTVNTCLFRECYLGGRLLRKLGFTQAANLYIDRIDRRFRMHNVSFSPQQWADLFSEGGLRVTEIVGSYPRKLMSVWSFLAWTPVRIFGFLRWSPFKTLNRMSTNLQRRIFTNRRLNPLDDEDPEGHTSILISAGK